MKVSKDIHDRPIRIRKIDKTAMKCKKHIPVWMYPSHKEVPKERLVDLLVKRLSGFSDLVICSECGMIAHSIKSRRGEFRWHNWSDSVYRAKEVDKAKNEWIEFGLTPPDVLNTFGIKV